MTSLIIGPIFVGYEKYKEHRDGKRKIRNAARYEDLRREHEGNLDWRDSEEARLDQQRMKTGFAVPEMSDDGRVRISRDWEDERARQWEARERELDYERFRTASLRPQQTGMPGAMTGAMTGSRISSMNTGRESWHTARGASLDMERGRASPTPRRSLQVGRSALGYESNDSLSGRSSQYDRPRSDMSRSRGSLEPQTIEVPKIREEEPKDMSSLFVDEILRERGLH